MKNLAGGGFADEADVDSDEDQVNWGRKKLLAGFERALKEFNKGGKARDAVENFKDRPFPAEKRLKVKPQKEEKKSEPTSGKMSTQACENPSYEEAEIRTAEVNKTADT